MGNYIPLLYTFTIPTNPIPQGILFDTRAEPACTPSCIPFVGDRFHCSSGFSRDVPSRGIRRTVPASRVVHSFPNSSSVRRLLNPLRSSDNYASIRQKSYCDLCSQAAVISTSANPESDPHPSVALHRMPLLAAALFPPENPQQVNARPGKAVSQGNEQQETGYVN